MDVGCGANCIFPLLGSRAFGYSFLATDVDPAALEVALQNVRANGLQAEIELRLVPHPQHTLDGVLRERERFDFVMCNPPFFDLSDARVDLRNPNRLSLASSSEWQCEGGEMGFISRLFHDSTHHRKSVEWFTVMCGKKSTWKHWRRRMQQGGAGGLEDAPLHLRTATLTQGRQSRWVLAWSWMER